MHELLLNGANSNSIEVAAAITDRHSDELILTRISCTSPDLNRGYWYAGDDALQNGFSLLHARHGFFSPLASIRRSLADSPPAHADKNVAHLETTHILELVGRFAPVPSAGR